MALLIEQVDPRSPPAMALLREAALEAQALYPELFAADAPLPGNPAATPGSVYLVAYDDHVAVGCAALRPVETTDSPGATTTTTTTTTTATTATTATAEVKRVYVLPPARRRGVARALLAQLDVEAVSLGYTALRLETGNRQQPALALYQTLGWQRIAPFGAHAGDATSVCFAKALPPVNQSGPAGTSHQPLLP